MAVRLEGAEIVLTVACSHPGGDSTVAVYGSVSDALSNWGQATRSSPLYPLNGSQWPSAGSYSVWFFGPFFPGDLPSHIRAFMSLGIYNVLLVATTDDEKSAVHALLTRHPKVIWERWDVDADRKIVGVDHSARMDAVPASHGDKGNINLPPGLRSAAEEYRTLVAATTAKARAYLPTAADEVALFDKLFRQRLESADTKPVIKSQWLVNVNAALSRFSSQAFAGISPVLNTECHYWTHSLLGVGMAAQALLAVRRQVQAAFVESDIPARLRNLANQAPNSSQLAALKPNDGFWQKNHLSTEAIDGPDEQISQIVCFSGRDGFRSTTQTLSVPLEVISSANTVGWTLRTVTHEFSHLFVDAILAALLPSVHTRAGAEKICALMKGPSNLYEQLQCFFAVTLCRLALPLEDKEGGKKKTLAFTADGLQRSVQVMYPELSELLTHIFDFLYFYQRDEKVYVSAIWGSWDVIPNIVDRIDEYIVRTVAAVMVMKLTAEDPCQTSMDAVSEELKALRARLPDANIIDAAISKLENDRKHFRVRLTSVMHLVAMSHAFLFSPDIAKMINKGAQRKRRRSRAEFKAGTFTPDELVANPVSFIYEQSAKTAQTNDPDFKKSAWMMAELAFSEPANG